MQLTCIDKQKNEMGETTCADGEAVEKSRNTNMIAEFSQLAVHEQVCLKRN